MASLLRTKYSEVRGKTGRLRIMCQSWMICVTANCFFLCASSMNVQINVSVGLIHHHRLLENYSLGFKQKSLIHWSRNEIYILLVNDVRWCYNSRNKIWKIYNFFLLIGQQCQVMLQYTYTFVMLLWQKFHSSFVIIFSSWE